MDIQVCADCGPTLWEVLLPLLLGCVLFVGALMARQKSANRLFVVLLAAAVALLWVAIDRLHRPW